MPLISIPESPPPRSLDLQPHTDVSNDAVKIDDTGNWFAVRKDTQQIASSSSYI